MPHLKLRHGCFSLRVKSQLALWTFFRFCTQPTFRQSLKRLIPNPVWDCAVSQSSPTINLILGKRQAWRSSEASKSLVKLQNSGQLWTFLFFSFHSDPFTSFTNFTNTKTEKKKKGFTVSNVVKKQMRMPFMFSSYLSIYSHTILCHVAVSKHGFKKFAFQFRSLMYTSQTHFRENRKLLKNLCESNTPQDTVFFFPWISAACLICFYPFHDNKRFRSRLSWNGDFMTKFLLNFDDDCCGSSTTLSQWWNKRDSLLLSSGWNVERCDIVWVRRSISM